MTMTATRSSSPPVYLIDASIYIFQAHFSPYVACHSRRGDDLAALYGFIRFLLQFLTRTGADTVAVAHDESLFSGFRHELCPDYKSNRELPDASLERQLHACFEVCEVLGLAAYASRRYEADDIIGVLAGRVRRPRNPRRVQIVSRDKDLAQLLAAPDDVLWDYQGDRRRGRDDILAEMGVLPEQIPDYLALVGDAVDCIAGVPGIGPVKARLLLNEFQSLESLYDNLDRVSAMAFRGAPRVAAQLAAHQERAELSKRLATIVARVDDDSEAFSRSGVRRLRRRPAAQADLKAFLAEYDFDADTTARLLRLAERAAAGPSR